MKVLHISDAYNGGGAESVFRDTLQTALNLGYKNEYFVSNEKTNIISYIFSIKNYFTLRNKLKNFQPDVIHIHNYYHYLSPSILIAIKYYKRKKPCKVIFTAHDYHLICPNSGLQYFKKNQRLNFSINEPKLKITKKYDHRSWIFSILKLSQHVLNYRILKLHKIFDLIISPSNFLRDVFIKNNIKTPITVVRNPINFIENSIAKEKLKNGLNIVFIGRLSPEKGFIEFIEKINQEILFPLNIHIYGKGEIEKKIRNIQLNHNINITLHGLILRENLISEISQYDLFCLPSVWYENAPISIIEAAEAGLPVLVPNYGGLLEMASLTNNYLTFNFNEKNLDKLLVNIKKGNAIKSKQEFSYEHYALTLKKIYG